MHGQVDACDVPMSAIAQISLVGLAAAGFWSICFLAVTEVLLWYWGLR